MHFPVQCPNLKGRISGVSQKGEKVLGGEGRVRSSRIYKLPARNWWLPSPLGETGPGHDKACQRKLILQVGSQHACLCNASLRFNATVKRITNPPAEKPVGHSRPFNSHQKAECHFQGLPTAGPALETCKVIICWCVLGWRGVVKSVWLG